LLGTSSGPAGNDDDDLSTATVSVGVAPSDFAVAGFSSSADAATMLSAITQVADVIQMCTDHWIASHKRSHEMLCCNGEGMILSGSSSWLTARG
jgi:hypothetical protein